MLGTAPAVDPSKTFGYAPRLIHDDPAPTCCPHPPSPQCGQQRPTRRSASLSAPSGADPLPSCHPPASSPLPPPPLSADEIWWQSAKAELPACLWLNALQKKAARHVRLPRSAVSGVAGSQHPKYIIENSPFSLVEKKCLQAGLEMQEGGRVQTHNTITTTFKGWGPMTAYHFCQVDKFKRLGMGSGALKVPIKGQSFSDVLTFAVPPITVIHKETADGWTATIDHYLAVYNSSDLCTLPSNSNTIYKGADPTELFKRTAKMILGEMAAREMPLSQALKLQMSREYCSGDSEEESDAESTPSMAEEAGSTST